MASKAPFVIAADLTISSSASVSCLEKKYGYCLVEKTVSSLEEHEEPTQRSLNSTISKHNDGVLQRSLNVKQQVIRQCFPKTKQSPLKVP